MIKINLATRKRAVGTADAKAPAAASPLGPLGGGNLDVGKGVGQLKESLGELPIRQIALIIIVGIGASYLLDGFKQQELQKRDAILATLNSEQLKLKAELAKTKGFEELKKQLDADEQTVRNKLDTIQALIADRGTPEKMLVAMSGGIPTDVWISQLAISDDKVAVKGASLGFNQITDFMKNLTDSEYYHDIHLQNTQQGLDDTGTEVALFELDEKREARK